MSPIHLSAVMCDGTEPRIIDCPHSNSTQNVNHGFDAYIVCRPRDFPYSSKSINVLVARAFIGVFMAIIIII